MAGYEFMDHTADVGIIARGRDLAEAFANVATGMFAFIVDLETVEERDVRQIEISSPDQESLLVDWLNELNFIFEVQGFVFRRFEVEDIRGSYLKARGFGETVDSNKHRLKSLVKSATYHMIKISKNSEWQVQVILDI